MSGEASGIVQSQISSLQGFANSALASAESALSSLGQLQLPNSYPTIYGVPTIPFTSPVHPSTPTTPNISGAPSIGGQVSHPVFPSPPSITQPSVGSLLALTMPSIPTIEMPVLNVTPPDYSFTPPTNWSFAVGDVFITDDPMIQAVMNRLYNNIKYGGTGLSADIEQAIWQRDLERNNQQLLDSTDKVTSMWAKKGFSLPDGQLAHSLSEVQKEFMNRLIDRSREISIKQAELEQKNLFQSMEMAVKLADTLINGLIRFQELVFKGQEATAKFANEFIDLQIKTYIAKLDGYKTTAQVFETLIRAQIAKADLYKSQIEGQLAIGQINEQTVKIYAEQIQANMALVDIYKAQVQAMTAELESDKIVIEANKLQLDAWAKTAEVQIEYYRAQVAYYGAEGQINVSAADLYSKQVEAQVRALQEAQTVTERSYEAAERSAIAKAQVMMEAARGIATAAASMAAGAMAAMSAHAGITYSETNNVTETGV